MDLLVDGQVPDSPTIYQEKLWKLKMSAALAAGVEDLVDLINQLNSALADKDVHKYRKVCHCIGHTAQALAHRSTAE